MVCLPARDEGSGAQDTSVGLESKFSSLHVYSLLFKAHQARSHFAMQHPRSDAQTGRVPVAHRSVMQRCQLWPRNEGGGCLQFPAWPHGSTPGEGRVLLCQQQPDALPQKILVPFSLPTVDTWGSVPQWELDLRCFGDVIGKWHVLWEPIPAPSRDVEFHHHRSSLSVLQHISISSADMPQNGKTPFLKYTFCGIFLY